MKRGRLGVHVLLVPELPKDLPFLWGAPVGDHLEVGHELLDLLLPVVERRRGRDDQEWTPDFLK